MKVIMLMMIYLLAMMLFSTVTSLMVLVLSLELLSWGFIIMLSPSMAFMYLMVQSYFVMISLVVINMSFDLLFWAILLKVGLPPFHGWLMNMLILSEVNVMLFMSLFHKFVPLLALGKIMTISSVFLLSIFIMITSSIMILQMGTMFQVLLFSSMINSAWMFLSLFVSMSLFLFFWCLYSLFSISLAKSENISMSNKLNFNQTLMTLVAWLALSGIPPFFLFWVKAEVLLGFVMMGTVSLMILFITSSLMSISAYYRISHLVLASSTQSKGGLAFLSMIGLILVYLF